MSPANAQIDFNALSSAICRGVSEGNAPLLSALVERGTKNHDLRGIVQANTDKVYSLDAEVKLLKGVIMALNGTGDGSSGSVPRLEANVSALKTQMGQVSNDIASMRGDISELLKGQNTTQGFMAGWKGVGVAIGLISTFISVIGGIIAVLIWLFTHGIKP